MPSAGYSMPTVGWTVFFYDDWNASFGRSVKRREGREGENTPIWQDAQPLVRIEKTFNITSKYIMDALYTL